jgi:nucleoside-triphosphatase THEP1
MPKGDGFSCRKIFIDGIYAGQEIVWFSTGESKCFSMKRGFIPKEWDEECSYDAYSFSKGGFKFARDIIDDIIRREITPVFIDEIGPLELQGKGFSDIFRLLIRTKVDVYVTVRESRLDDVIRKFKLGEHEVISIV